MGYLRKKFEQKGWDERAYKRALSRHQAEYIRARLRVVASYASGMEFSELCQKHRLSDPTCRSYVNIYLQGGLEGLCSYIERPRSCALSDEQAAAFKRVLLERRPAEVGLEGNIWTGELMRRYLLNTFGVTYKSGIYDLLERLNLSHQKAHADYSNADPQAQAVFLQDFKDTLLQSDERTAVVHFDEFSVSSRPSAHYGWAEKNTRPKVPTDEKNESAPTVF